MPILKPNTPMISQGQEFYPLTHASQIIKSDGTRLEQDGKIFINGGTNIPPDADITVNSVNAGKYELNNLDLARIFSPLIPLGSAIPGDTDLNSIDYLKVGNYYCSMSATAASLANCPTADAFMMTVYSPLMTAIDNENESYKYRVRKIMTYQGVEYIQACSTGSVAGEWTYSDWQAPGDGLPTTGGTITGSIISNTAAKGFVCNVNGYDVRMQTTGTGNRGLYDNGTSSWIVLKDSSNNVTLNGNATTATTATKLASGALAIMHIADWSGEIAANGYTSRIDLTPTSRSGYVFLDCTGYSSNSSYICPYGMFKTDGKIAVYFRNLSSSKITPSMSFWGLYQKI